MNMHVLSPQSKQLHLMENKLLYSNIVDATTELLRTTSEKMSYVCKCFFFHGCFLFI